MAEKLLEEMNNEVESTECTEIVAILDRSGSMCGIQDDAIGSFNAFLSKQQEMDGKARLTLVLFDDQYELVYEGVDIMKVQPLDNKTYVPRGMTALLDAIGKTVNDVKDRINKTSDSEKPDKVIVAILTDGQENYSCEYNRNAIMKIIDEKDDNWEFLYLAANQDAIQEGGSIGIGVQNCHAIIGDGSSFARDIGVASGMACFNAAVSNYRSAGHTNFGSEQTEAFVAEYNESKEKNNNESC